MITEQLQALAKALEIEPDKLNDDFLLPEGGEWDSIVLISLISIVDKHFGVLLNGNQLQDASTFRDLKKIIANEMRAIIAKGGSLPVADISSLN